MDHDGVRNALESSQDRGSRIKALVTVWDALHSFREDLIPEGDEMFDEQWSDICEAMDLIHDVLDIRQEEV